MSEGVIDYTVVGERKFSKMKLPYQSCAVLLKVLVFEMFGLVNVNMQTVTSQLTDPSAEFQSTYYLETHQNIYEAWTIIVDESHRIRLQFLDFGLHETPQCTDDFLNLFDGPAATSVLIGKWCWNSFAELSPTTYISSSKFFYLRLRINGIGSRRGFKANYTSFNPDFSQTTSKYSTEQNTPTTNVLDKTPPQQHLSSTSSEFETAFPKTTNATITKDVQTTSSDTELPSEKAIPSTRFATTQIFSRTDYEQSTTELVLSYPNSLRNLGISAGALLIVCLGLLCFLGCCCYVRSKKRKSEELENPPVLEVQGISAYTRHSITENYSVRYVANPEPIIRVDKDEAVETTSFSNGGEQSSNLMHTLPNGRKILRNRDDSDSRRSLSTEENYSVDETYARVSATRGIILCPPTTTVGEMVEENTDFEVNVAYQSYDLETDYESYHEYTDSEYAYVDTVHDLGRMEVGFNNVVDTYDDIHSQELVPNVAYQSFDSTENQEINFNIGCDVLYSVPKREQCSSEGMVTNDAYQSYGSDDEEATAKSKNEVPYYHVLEVNDNEKTKEQGRNAYEQCNIKADHS